MIAALREWLTTIVMVTMLLTVVQGLIPEGSIRKISSFIGGLILLVALVQPVLDLDWNRLDLQLEDYEAAIRERQEELAGESGNELQKLIAERTAAYISDKADTLGLAVEARVETRTGADGVPVPYAAELWGVESGELAAYMETELGIPRGRQVWYEGEN